MQKKELSAVGAMSAKLHVSEGSMMKILAVMGYINAFADVQAAVPCEY
jgi:hypothetical protein